MKPQPFFILFIEQLSKTTQFFWKRVRHSGNANIGKGNTRNCLICCEFLPTIAIRNLSRPTTWIHNVHCTWRQIFGKLNKKIKTIIKIPSFALQIAAPSWRTDEKLESRFSSWRKNIKTIIKIQGFVLQITAPSWITGQIGCYTVCTDDKNKKRWTIWKENTRQICLKFKCMYEYW